jgi:predicted MFS family arabinose efflux permease
MNLFTFVQTGVYVLYGTRAVGLPASTLSLIYLVGGIGAVSGAALNAWVSGRVGVGMTLVYGALLQGLGVAVVPLASEARGVSLLVLAGDQLLFGLGLVLYGVGQLSVRQVITPAHLRGRMNATVRFAVTGVIPVGALIGGVLGERVGLQATTLIGGLGTLTAWGWLIISPLRGMRELPPEIE